MRDVILHPDGTIVFYKKLWHDSEILLAKCFNFEVNIESGEIKASVLHTFKKAVYEFVRLSFKNFSESLEAENRRNSFYLRLDEMYETKDKSVDDIASLSLPYYDKLYAHQIDTIKLAYYNQYIFGALDMGLGKTLISASLSRMLKVPRTVIVCPAAVKWNWYRDLTHWGFNELFFTILDSTKRRTVMALNERFLIINYDIVDKFEKHLSSGEIGHFIFDECFVYDTIIHTNKGSLKIGDIVKNKIKCSALSYDCLNNEYIYKPITNWLKKPLNKKLITINADGKQFTCTEDHKIWTRYGFKRAKEISNKDELLALQFGIYNTNKRDSHSDILQQEMLCSKIKRKRFFSYEIVRGSKKTASKNKYNLLRLQKRIFGYKKSIKEKSKILLNFMFSKMENERCGFENKKETNRLEISFQKNERNSFKKAMVSEKLFYKNETKQPNNESRDIEKNVFKSKRKNFFVSWRKWSINGASKKTTFTNWLGNGISYKNNFIKRISQIFTNSLQSRFSYSRKENRNRSRWFKPQNKEMEIFRQKENGNFKYVRVESCEILERGSNEQSNALYREGFVYDLTVEDNHNYFANGILVSNCHYLKNHRSNRYKAVKKLVDKHPNAKVTFLSGTPVSNRVDDIFAYMKLIGHQLGSSYQTFLKEYTISTSSRGGNRVTGGRNLQDLNTKLSNFMIRKTKEECLDLPDKIFLSYRYEMDDYRAEYDAVIEELSKNKELSSLTGNLHSLNIITSKAKIKGIIEIAENIIEQGRKVVVFGSYKEPLNQLEAYFKEKCVKIDGSVDSWTRDQHIQRFHNDPECEVFLGNMKAAGVGINLTNASDVLFINFPFTPAELYQAIDRCNRIGQKNTVNVHYTFCDDSIDEYIYDIIVDKEKDINALIDQGKEVLLRENTTEILMKKLLKRDDVIIDTPFVEVQGEEVKENGIADDLQPEVDRCANYELGNETVVLPEFQDESGSFEVIEDAIKRMNDNGSQFISSSPDIFTLPDFE